MTILWLWKVKSSSLKVLILLLVVFCLLYSTIGSHGSSINNKDKQLSKGVYNQRETTPLYINHEPIRISGNEDLLNTAADEEWPGTGSLTDPIIITGYNITTESIRISVSDVDLHFQIKDNYLDGLNESRKGILFSQVTHGGILNNTIKGSSFGIYLSHSDNNCISNNRIFSNMQQGLTLYYSNQNNITSNILLNNPASGVCLSNSEYNMISNNICHSNRVGVTTGFSSNYNNIINNTIYNNEYGLNINNDYNNITTNEIYSNHEGIDIAGASKCIISENLIFRNDDNGIVIANGVKQVNITKNIIYKNSNYGINNLNSEDVKDNRIVHNDFIRNGEKYSLQSQVNLLEPVYVNENFWDDWTIPDINGDGFIDNPYRIGDVTLPKEIRLPQDNLPLTEPFNPTTFHYLTRAMIINPSSEKVLKGMVTINWTKAKDSLNHEIFFSLFYTDDGGVVWNLLLDKTTSLSYEWNTTTVMDGSDYHIKVLAMCSDNITAIDISNDKFTIQNHETNKTSYLPLMESMLVLLALSLIIKRK